MNTNNVKRPQMPEKENSCLKKIIAGQALDIAVLKNVNGKNLCALPDVKHKSNGGPDMRRLSYSILTLKKLKYYTGAAAAVKGKAFVRSVKTALLTERYI